MSGIREAFRTSKPMLREFFPLMVMVALQQLLALTVNLVDNFMLGVYSESSMAAASLVNQIQFILQSVTMGAGLGVAILGSQYWGKRQPDTIKRLIVIGLVFGMAFGILFCVVTLIWPEQILSLLTTDATLIAEGVRYLKLMCWTYLIFSASSILVYSLQAVQTAWVGMMMSAITICINMSFNYTFIYGNFGAPEMGIQGAGIATLTSRSIELVIILVYVLLVDKKLKTKFRELFRFDKSYVPDYFEVAFPVMLSGALWGVAMAVQTAILGHMSAEAVAANGVAAVIFQLFVTFGFAQANAASVTIGKCIGAGNMHLVKNYAKVLQLIFIAMGILTGTLLLLCSGAIVSFYSLTPATRELTMSFLTVLGITSMFSIYEYPVEGGIIAGGGNTAYQAWVDNLFMWLWTIPASALCAFVFDMSPLIVFIALKSDQIFKCIPNAIKCNRFKWARNLTRD